jgi:hypothetical protein
MTVGLLFALALVVGQGTARAQGVTGAAVNGRITTEGAPVMAVELTLVAPSTGDKYTSITDENGNYFFDNVRPGGPYVLTATALGFVPTGRQGIILALGQRLKLDMVMRVDAGETITIIETVDPLADPSRTGPATNLGGSTIARLPLQGRNFTDLAGTAPQVVGSSIAGQNNRYNNIQIDGGANNDLFGLSGNGTPGGQSNAKPISIEAIDQFVIEIAPFDVRQSSFTGGLVNAITKRGTNEVHGSLFGYYTSKSLAGFRDDPTFLDFNTLQLGLSVGGPIIKDKLHIFLAADFQGRESAFGNQFQLTGDATADMMASGFTTAEVDRFVTLLEGYGVQNPGNGLSTNTQNPDHNVFVKLSTNQIPKSQLDISYNLVEASSDQVTRAPLTAVNLTTGANLRDGYQLSNAGYQQVNSTHTVRAKLTTNWAGGRLSNELLTGFSIIRDQRDMPQRLPLIMVRVGRVGSSDSWLSAGGERFSHQNELDQNIFTFQDNLTWSIGRHRITFGTSNEYLDVRNLFLQAAYGVWAFDSLDSFMNGTASVFQRRFGGSDQLDPGTAKFSAFQVGAYVQDEWNIFDRLTITPGFRIDIPFLSSAVTNDRLASNTTFPIDTGDVPSGNLLLSPRLGFNWNVEGNNNTIVRGGVGIFTGRPPYVWVSNAYVVNGLAQVQLTCAGATGVPAFTVDPDNQPSDCMGGTGTPTPPTNAGEVDYFDPDTKYPQNMRVALGVDRKLPLGITASGDFLYTRDVNGWYYEDANLVEQDALSGEGRFMYGTINAMGRGVPMRVDTMNLTQAVRTSNKNGGRVITGTVQVLKSFGKWVDASVAYTYSNSKDLMSLTSSQALSNFQFAPVDGSIYDRNVRPSAFDRPHKITITATASLPAGFNAGLQYIKQSGLPYTWTINGDVNADGISGNDAAFIPATAADITLQNPAQFDALNAFIESQDCLAGARGRLIQRGECRNPWLTLLNARVGWRSPVLGSGGERFELQLDVFNILNLLNDDWGVTRQAAPFEQVNLLQSVGFDMANNRPIYSFTMPSRVVSRVYSPTVSRWRIQLGARYSF